ncbi:MAG: hypothetical protein KDB80_04085 [Planctomycetes bacterium]|nr:hypothetical protein [Planctomycetota bacterium]
MTRPGNRRGHGVDRCYSARPRLPTRELRSAASWTHWFRAGPTVQWSPPSVVVDSSGFVLLFVTDVSLGGLLQAGCGPSQVSTHWTLSISNPEDCATTRYGPSCAAELLGRDYDPEFLGQIVLELEDLSLPDFGVLLLGPQAANWPTPWNCSFLVDSVASIPIGLDPLSGFGRLVFPPEAVPVPLYFQGATANIATQVLHLSNGVRVECP